MKRMLTILVAAVFMMNSSAGFASDSDWYIKGGAGFFIPEDADTEFEYQGKDYDIAELVFDKGFSLNTAAGITLGNGFGLELEFAYHNADLDKFKGKSFQYGDAAIATYDVDLTGDTAIKTLMINGLYNLKNNSSFTPYAGVGIGLGWIDIEANDEEHSDTNFAFQVLAGVEIALTDRIALGTGYRYLNAGEVSDDGEYTVRIGNTLTTVSGEYSLDMDSHNLEAVLKYSF